MSKILFVKENTPDAHQTKILEHYTLGTSLPISFSHILGETLGRGTFGKVKLGTHKLTHEKVTYHYLA
jgi:hypothetical protein